MIDLFGKTVSVIASRDPTTLGLRGTLMLESMKMLVISTPTGLKSIPKLGSVLRVEDKGGVVNCDSIRGRVEDRVGRRARRR